LQGRHIASGVEGTT